MVEDTNLFDERPEDDWERDVWLMARRAALLYHYLASAIVSRLGHEEGYELVKEAVWQYGTHVGKSVRESVLNKGQQLTKENFQSIADLPSRGWRSEMVETPDGRKEHRTILCPLARTWMELGEHLSLARLYCYVDQAKMEAYNGEELECIHAHNVLDGDDFCEVVIREKQED